MTKKNSTKAELLAHIQALEHRVAGSSSGMGNAVDNLAHRKRTPVEYTDSMVIALLELRFNAYSNAFNGSRSAKQLNLLWEKLTVQFNIATNQIINNKLRKLRAEFMVVQCALVQTGNSNNDEYTVPEAKKRKAEVVMELKLQRQGRKNAQTDISQGLEKFGNTLGAAIVQAANNPTWLRKWLNVWKLLKARRPASIVPTKFK
ncbi:hypothetical protein H257_03295 [Aphanomyces astaci]|uniref:Uncharacterized protein n=1 Tax=Aphanomyces astaci TaxID=112090 RepID=W4H131_APHAT|nr:hypothetical protein H257_03295 [Aphanomyces astaci]ETV85587.1 hypothetical protein H257_03295 [Aphanomyces astaci]|eukprot:XP_009825605.1 hypothetical protein H257_03295 [Aphanomyces astaci]